MISTGMAERGAQARRMAQRPNEPPATPVASAPGNGDASLPAELAEWKERYLRLAADFDNYKKRTARESGFRATELRNGFVRALLPVVDNLERALTNEPAPSTEQLRDGVQLTMRQLLQVLEAHGFAGREDLGQPFDPQYHEAVCVRAEPRRPDQTILEVWQRGWRQGNSMFRPAKVVVNDLKNGNQPELEANLRNQKGATHG